MIKSKKATIIVINKDNKCFQYPITVTLSREKIAGLSERITKIKLLKIKYNWDEITYPSEKDDWKIFDKSNLTIALNGLYSKIHPAYVSKHNSNREKQVTLLVIFSGDRYQYLAGKKLSALLIGITSNIKAIYIV